MPTPLTPTKTRSGLAGSTARLEQLDVIGLVQVRPLLMLRRYPPEPVWWIALGATAEVPGATNRPLQSGPTCEESSDHDAPPSVDRRTPTPDEPVVYSPVPA